ncbi:MAG: MBL fold metallo-hydrolase [Bacteroidales bacterium]|nr:MBL fold metallo-hydrolase [Bacteroidales bacterium]
MPMMLSEKIKGLKVEKGEVALFYLGQAGFYIKTPDRNIVIDAYLTDAVERLFNFKRMIPAMITPDEVDADLFLSTHSHADHLDPDALPVLAKKSNMFFIGSPDCEELYRQNGIAEDRFCVLKPDQEWKAKNIRIKAIYANHGDLAPDAVGLLIDMQGIKLYHTGDTSFDPDKIRASLPADIDMMIAPINGQYGNLNASEACKLAGIINPKILIASHFWMFLEHVGEGGTGDPATFLKESKNLPGSMKAMVMAPGELLKYRR